MTVVRPLMLVLALALGVSGCASAPPATRQAYAGATPCAMVSGQTPSGVYGISVPDVYYQSANSFPRGAASSDECRTR